MSSHPLPPSQPSKPAGLLFSCFISYSSLDQAFAEQLHTDLERHGVKCWFAPHDMKIGDKIRQRIEDTIQEHDKLLLVLSEHSVESVWVESEVETAFEKERQQKRLMLFPIRLDDAVMQTRYAWAAEIRRTGNIADFRGWTQSASYQQGLDGLLRDLQVQAQP
jgi:TIR domain